MCQHCLDIKARGCFGSTNCSIDALCGHTYLQENNMQCTERLTTTIPQLRKTPCLPCRWGEALNTAHSASHEWTWALLSDNSSNIRWLHLDLCKQSHRYSINMESCIHSNDQGLQNKTYLLSSSSERWLVSGIQEAASFDWQLFWWSCTEPSVLACFSNWSRAAMVSLSISIAWTLETCLWMDEGSENASSQQHQSDVSRLDVGIFLDPTNVAKVCK